MRIKIDKNYCKFIVKPESRKVICIWKCNKSILIDFLNNMDNGFFYLDGEWDRLEMRPYYTGVATCAPEDTWDEELGKLIAFSKMKKKFCTAFFKRVNFFFDNRDKLLNHAAEACDRMGERWNREIDTLDKEIDKRLSK